MMIRLFVVSILSVTSAYVLADGPPKIFLPPQARVVNYINVVGNNINLSVSQTNQVQGLKDQWNVFEETNEVGGYVNNNHYEQTGHRDHSGSQNSVQGLQDQWANVLDETNKVEQPRRHDEQHGIVNNNLYEQTKRDNAASAQELGPIEDELYHWIETRATELCDKIDRYETELMENVKDEQRVVVQVLLLNTLVDLDNLIKENIRSMKWVKNKLRAVREQSSVYASQVEDWIKSKIGENLVIESKIRGTNKPDNKWLINTQAIKRILYEQRFSEQISKVIVDFLGGKWSMMERFRVFDINHSDKKRLEDGLYYKAAKGHVPAHFPFSAQEAMSNGF